MPNPSVSAVRLNALAVAAKSGDSASAEALIAHDSLQRIVVSIAKQLDPMRLAQGWDPMPTHGLASEVQAAANLGILQALAKFDPARGTAFSTFAYRYIQGEVRFALWGKTYEAGGQALRPTLHGLGESGTGEDAAPTYENELMSSDPDYGLDAGYLRVVSDENAAEVREFVAAVPEHQRQILTRVYFQGETPSSIAATRGVSRQAVSKSLNSALNAGRESLAHLRVAA